MKLDRDLKELSAGEARQELMRIRRLVRTHRDRRENARCWHADLELYARILPEQVAPGRMTLPLGTLLMNCERYIRRQQCQAGICPNRSPITSKHPAL